MDNILIIGSGGQLGSELEDYLVSLYGREKICSSDIKKNNSNSGNFILLDALDKDSLYKTIKENNIKVVYHLAAILSAKGEDNPIKTWNLNMNTLFNILELAKEKILSKVFWPSSIAVFGPSSPKNPAPQFSIMDPTTVYGISKLAGERWCEYYNKTYSTDIRSIRFPGIISYKSLPGGGTTDYAVDIFHSAMKDQKYSFASNVSPQQNIGSIFVYSFTISKEVVSLAKAENTPNALMIFDGGSFNSFPS